MTETFPALPAHPALAPNAADGADTSVLATLRAVIAHLAAVEYDLQETRVLVRQLEAQLDRQTGPLQYGRLPAPARPAASVPPRFGDAPNRPLLQINCFGAFEVHWGVATILFSGKGGIILKYLATLPRQPVRRDVLLEGLWPHVDPRRSNNTLKVALHQLRQSWGSVTGATGSTDYVIFRDGCYGFNPELSIWTDVEAFEQAWQAGW